MVTKIVELAGTQELTFDLDALGRITGREMNLLIKPSDLEKLAEVFAKYVISCPAAWGDPKSADTYLDLPFKGEGDTMQGVIQAMAEAIKNDR